MRRPGLSFAFTMLLLGCVLALAQEPTGIDFPVRPSPPLSVGDLRPSPDARRGQLEVRNSGPSNQRFEVPVGTAFTASGVQAVMVLQSSSADVPARSSANLILDLLCAEAELAVPK